MARRKHNAGRRGECECIAVAKRYASLPLLVLGAFSAVSLAPMPVPGVELVGYVPYYRMSNQYVTNVLPAQLALLDEVRYFGLTVDSSAQVVPTSNSLAYHKANIATINQIIEGLPEGQRPRLGITLGGAAQDATFTTVAASDALRSVLASEVDALLNETGAAAVDIDWEHPDAGIQRSIQYPALLKSIKQAVGEDRRVYATVAPSVVISNTVFSGPHAIDGVSLMTYDMGWWGNDPSNPNQGEHSLPEYVEDAVAAWTEPPGSPNQRPWVFGSWGNGSPRSQVGVGLPFYGRNIVNNAAFTYGQLVSGGATTDGNYYSYQGQTVWIPGPSAVEDRVAFAIDNGLQNLFIWEVAQDLAPNDPDSLLRRAFDARAALAVATGDYNADGVVDVGDLDLWRSTFGATVDLRADGNASQQVDVADYAVWREAIAAESSAMPANVPEPSQAMLVLIAQATIYASVTRLDSRSRSGLFRPKRRLRDSLR